MQLEQASETRTLSLAELTKMLDLKMEIKRIAKAEETSWRQKSRCLCLKEGDRNTKYFQKIANSNKRYNHISKLKIGNEVIEEKEHIRKEILDFYGKLYTENEHWRPTTNFENLSTITEEDSRELEKPFEEEKILETIRPCAPDKAPEWLHHVILLEGLVDH